MPGNNKEHVNRTVLRINGGFRYRHANISFERYHHLPWFPLGSASTGKENLDLLNSTWLTFVICMSFFLDEHCIAAKSQRNWKFRIKSARVTYIISLYYFFLGYDLRVAMYGGCESLQCAMASFLKHLDYNHEICMLPLKRRQVVRPKINTTKT